MLIDSLHHPFFHNATRVWAMNVDIRSRHFILESYARPRSSSFRIFLIAKRLSVSSYVKSLGLLLKRSTSFSFVPMISHIFCKGTTFGTNLQTFFELFREKGANYFPCSLLPYESADCDGTLSKREPFPLPISRKEKCQKDSKEKDIGEMIGKEVRIPAEEPLQTIFLIISHIL